MALEYAELDQAAVELPVDYIYDNPNTTSNFNQPVQSMHISPYESPFTSTLDTEARLQPIQSVSSGFAKETMCAFTKITGSSNIEEKAVRKRNFSLNKRYPYNHTLNTEASSQPFPTVFTGIPNGTMQNSPATSTSTAIAYSSDNEKRAVHACDFTGNERQRSPIVQNPYPFSPDSFDTNGQIVHMTNDPTHNSHTLPTSVKPYANYPVAPSGKPFFNIPEDRLTLRRSLPLPTRSSALCDTCGQVFDAGRHSRGNLKRHKEAKHVPRSNWKFQCADCGKTFSRSDGLKMHRRTTHSSYSQLIHNISRHRLRNPNNS